LKSFREAVEILCRQINEVRIRTKFDELVKTLEHWLTGYSIDVNKKRRVITLSPLLGMGVARITLSPSGHNVRVETMGQPGELGAKRFRTNEYGSIASYIESRLGNI